MYGGGFRRSIVNGFQRFPTFSTFLPACMNHVYLPPVAADLYSETTSGFTPGVEPWAWEQTVVEGVSLQAALTAWAKSGNGPVRLMDSCSMPGCNSTCPENLDININDNDGMDDTGAVVVVLIFAVVLIVPLASSVVSMVYAMFWSKRYTSKVWTKAVTETSSQGKEKKGDPCHGVSIPVNSKGEFFLVARDLNYYVPSKSDPKGEIQILKHVDCE